MGEPIDVSLSTAVQKHDQLALTKSFAEGHRIWCGDLVPSLIRQLTARTNALLIFLCSPVPLGSSPDLFDSKVEPAPQKSTQSRTFGVSYPCGNLLDVRAAGFQQMHRAFHP